jgi:hypothetical protein
MYISVSGYFSPGNRKQETGNRKQETGNRNRKNI